MRKDPDYDKVILSAKLDGVKIWWKLFLLISIYSTIEHRAMLGHCEMILESDLEE